VAWRSNPINCALRKRDIALADLMRYLPHELQYFSLHTHPTDVEAAVLQADSRVRQFPDDMLGFADTAALCECMDLVISVDTSLAHLGAALGKPTWVLLPRVPDWRWLTHREDSPWYPTVKLYRQERRDDWQGVITRLARDLSRRWAPQSM
jgi:ADP-heptose:LPS heptosyltransferase